MAGLTPLLAGERLKAAPACHPTRPRPLFLSLARAGATEKSRRRAIAPPSPCTLAIASLLTPASPRLHRCRLELFHLATEPENQGRRCFSSSPQRSTISAGVGVVLAMANHHRSPLPPSSPFPQFPCVTLMLTPSSDRATMAGVGRRTSRSATATAIAAGDLLRYS